MKVAIADDDPIVCSSLATILAATGAAEVPWTANSGEAAMSKYDENVPDMLLIDVQMPGMDGLTASERILHAHPDARILVLTTFADEAYIAGAVRMLDALRGSVCIAMGVGVVMSAYDHFVGGVGL